LTRFALGRMYVQEGKTSDAILQFTEGVRLLPDDPDGYHLLADELVAEGRRDEAIAVYRKALRFLPGNPMIRLYLANTLRQPDEIAEARRLYEEVIRIKPDCREAMDSIAVLQGMR
jgi:tetratricopeptide (TPR) repeat protein